MRDSASRLFDAEIKRKKLLARSAHSKVTPGRKVNLSSDYLTPAQQRKLNGPILTYRMHPNVPAEDLAKWPEDLRQEYMARFGGDADAVQPEGSPKDLTGVPAEE